MSRSPRCFHWGDGDLHAGDLTWEDNGRAYCPRCLRYRRALAKRVHPAGKALNLPPLDARRCYAHNRDDKLSCPECIANSEDRAVYLND